MYGVTSENGIFFGSLTVLASHEDIQALSEVYNFVHDYGGHFQYFMGDGAKAITSTQEKIFSDCDLCKSGKRLMCYVMCYENKDYERYQISPMECSDGRKHSTNCLKF